MWGRCLGLCLDVGKMSRSVFGCGEDVSVCVWMWGRCLGLCLDVGKMCRCVGLAGRCVAGRRGGRKAGSLTDSIGLGWFGRRIVDMER